MQRGSVGFHLPRLGVLLCSLLVAAAPAVDRPHSFLVSIVDLPLAQGESLESFSFQTWGVSFRSVCRIPTGWRIRAGQSATPDGSLEGEGSHGVTWFHQRDPAELQRFVLVTLNGPVRRRTVTDASGQAIMPPSFSGTAQISSPDRERTVPLTYRNIRLVSAARCSPVGRTLR